MPLTEQQITFFDIFGCVSFPGLFAREAESITQGRLYCMPRSIAVI